MYQLLTKDAQITLIKSKSKKQFKNRYSVKNISILFSKYLIRQKFVGPKLTKFRLGDENFSKENFFFFEQNFRHRVEISPILSDKFCLIKYLEKSIEIFFDAVSILELFFTL